MAEDDDIKQSGMVLFGENRKLSEPAIKILLELLKEKDPLLKSELEDSELVPYTRAQSFTDIMSLSLYQGVLDTFARTKMARKRKRVKELLEAISPNRPEEKPGFLSRMFGGGR